MKIAILDDDNHFCEILKARISAYGGDVHIFNDANSLCLSDTVFDIAFMDIEVSGSGLKAARYVKLRNPDCIIAFVTNHAEFMAKGYEFRIFRYILKSEPKTLMDKRINDVFNEYIRIHKYLNGKYKGEDFKIRIKDIVYIEITGRVANIHTARGSYKMYVQMTALEKELEGGGFIRCHRSFLVNNEFIRSVKNDSAFELFTGEAVPISRGYKARAKAAYAYLTEV